MRDEDRARILHMISGRQASGVEFGPVAGAAG
jgi:hypothetical protein